MQARSGQLKKIAEGREAELFAWEDRKILRLMREPGVSALARVETDRLVLKRAAEHGLPVPAVYEVVEVTGRPGIIMERIEGPDLLTMIGRSPWRVFWVAGVGGRIHARIHGIVAPSEAPSIRERIIDAVRRSPHVPRAIADAALQTLGRLPDGGRLLHGDYHPGNILMAGKTPVVIDWSNVARGHPAADVARTMVILGSGSPPPGIALPIQLMALFGRRLLVSSYLRAYRRVAPLDMDLVRRWEQVRLADRLAEGIAEERPKLLRRLSTAFGVSA